MNENIFYSDGNIDEEDRQKLTGHRGGVFWFFGLSGSGKSAITRIAEEMLNEKGILCFRLDGDNLRSGLNSDLGFSIEDRKENIRRAAEAAKLMAKAGIVVLSTFITPLNENRESAQKILGDYYHGIYVKCSVDVCEKRDPKGLYKKAKKGEIKDFTGVSAPFEEPDQCSFTINTEINNEKECAIAAVEYIFDIIK